MKKPSRKPSATAPSPVEESVPEEITRLFANTADGVWVSGPHGEIRFWNRAAESILGYPAAQVLGRFCRDVFGGCDKNGNRLCGWPCPIKTLLRGGDLVEHFDMATRTRTGQPVWIDISCVAVPSGDDRPPTIVHLFRDVTAAHQIDVLVRQHLARIDAERAAGEETALPRIDELSQRERQVVAMMRSGATTATIARQLYISKATVRNHVQNIFAKLRVHNRLEAVAYVNRIARDR
jgi:PAS domain S-box-containing protein